MEIKHIPTYNICLCAIMANNITHASLLIKYILYKHVTRLYETKKKYVTAK